MKTILKPTDKQIQRLMNLIALPAMMDDESIGDRFDFRDGNGEWFLDNFVEWLEQTYPDLYAKIEHHDDEYSSEIEYFFWPEEDGCEEPYYFEVFQKCAEYIYAHKNALEGVCEELQKFLDDGIEEDYFVEYEYWNSTMFSDEDEYRAELKRFFKDVQYNDAEVSRVKNQKIFNGNVADAKPGRKAPSITKDEFWEKLLHALSWNESKEFVMKDFMKDNPAKVISRSGNFALVQGAMPPSLDEPKLRKTFIEKFVPANPLFRKVFKDLGKIDLELDADDTYKTLLNVIDYKDDFIPYANVVVGKGEGWFASANKKSRELDQFIDDVFGDSDDDFAEPEKPREVIPVAFYIYWDGDSLRAFLPVKGNPINVQTKTFIDVDGEIVANITDVDYLRNTGYCSPERIVDMRPNFDECERQLKLRLIIE